MTAAPSRLAAALSDRYLVERELGRGGMATALLQTKALLTALAAELGR